MSVPAFHITRWKTIEIMISVISKPSSWDESNASERDQKWAVTITKLENNDKFLEVIGMDEYKDSRYLDLAFAFLIPLICIFMAAGFILIPQHNILEEPEYWYEISVPLTWSWMIALWALTILRLKIFFIEIPSLTSVKACAKIFLQIFLQLQSLIVVTHLVWTNCLGYIYPIPWLCLIILVPFTFTFCATMWFAFPSRLRNDEQYRERIKGFLAYGIHFANACGERLLMIWLFSITSFQLQPIWAFVLPAWRELDHWILQKLENKATDGKNRDATMFTSIEHKCNYAVFLSVALGLYATTFASYAILVIDNAIKFYDCFKMVKENKRIKMEARKNCRIGNDLSKRKLENHEAIQDLILDEFVEILMPVVYLGLVIIGYYGPNSDVLGNIGAEKWTWQKIFDVEKFSMAVLRMFVIDLLALLINSLILWKFCSVHAIKGLCYLIRNYWSLITVTMGGAIVKVRLK